MSRACIFVFVSFLASIGSTVCLAGKLHDAVRDGDVSSVEKLLLAGENANESDFLLGTALHYACVADDAEIVELLIKHGSDIEAVSELVGSRSLHLAAEAGSTRVLRVLLQSGAEVEAPDSLDRKPLGRAAAANQPAAIEILLAHGAEIESRDKVYGRTALIEAAYAGRIASSQALLNHGADIDVRDLRGKTAFWYAATPESFSPAGGPELLILLAKRGADIEAEDNTGFTPLAWARAGIARASIYQQIADTLVELGAER